MDLLFYGFLRLYRLLSLLVDTNRYAKPGWKNMDVKPDIDCGEDFPALGGGVFTGAKSIKFQH